MEDKILEKLIENGSELSTGIMPEVIAVGMLRTEDVTSLDEVL